MTPNIGNARSQFRLIVIALGVLVSLTSLCIFLFAVSKSDYQPQRPTAELITILLPKITPTVYKIERTPANDIDLSQIQVGAYVQISGTEKDGLRLRAGPGTSYNQLFLGMEAEVFKVTDGPESANGFSWWYLVAPYDTSRSGWAASDYLVRVNPE
jgi:hypothetical protein